jgi:GNAT superfamily N-acetyltransferase
MTHIFRITEASTEMADSLTRIIRSAYADGDLVPGLPVADGARAEPAELLDDLAAGCPLWMATVDGEPAGTVRAVPRGPHTWEVRRLAVAPALRRSGTARALLGRLEAEAVTAGVTEVTLDAVVERGNPAFYARVGYRTVRHFAADDKPLSEVHMSRDPRTPADPAADDRWPTEPGLTLTWVATSGGTACRLSRPDDPAETVLGVDFLAGADPAGPGGGDFDRPAAEIPGFRMPRTVHPGLLAWWRSPAVRRQAVTAGR